MPIAREGWPLILVPLGLAVVLFLLRWPWTGGVLLLLGLFTAFFFRDPDRAVPGDPRLVLSPADGKVIVAGPAPAGNPLGEGATQVSVFLSIFDVHVNRAPIGGLISRVEYHEGQFLPAFQDKASLANEQNSVTIDAGGAGQRVAFKQIAGLIARRIIFKKQVGDTVAAGERVGMIKFGSRVDVFLPRNVLLRVRKGDRVVAGVSALGERP
ncbi:MAG: phosphatidylserine decarboxylase family protein [Acidobacteria bacterium]|nr:MAG: phosphatidylserine decarboxylase family protein [Acidobacteriota bacterium]